MEFIEPSQVRRVVVMMVVMMLVTFHIRAVND